MKNYSKQRDLIIDILKKSYSHPTADEIFEDARKIQPHISLGTIYRNLDTLEKNGIIEKISNPAGKDRFDLKKSKHSHAICKCCGKVFDFTPNFDMISLKSEILKQTKLETTNDEIRVIGICENCRNK